jgi:hypothetical protein
VDRFFSLVWRVNALLIFGVGLAGFALIAFLIVELGLEIFEPRNVQGVVNIASEEIESESFSFGDFIAVPGSDFLSAPLYTERGSPRGSISRYNRSIRNYLFYNPTNGAAHWLLSGNGGLVESRYQFPASQSSKDPEPIRGVLWRIITVDTNGDQIISNHDLSSISISDASGSSLRELIPRVQHIHGAVQFSPDLVSLAFLKENRLRAAVISLNDLSLVSNEEILPLPNAEE